MTPQEFQQRYTYNPTTDKLGEGGFGSVFKAYDNYRDRWVALKISKVNPQYESIRLRKEVEMVAKLPEHPNIAYYEECYTFPQMDGEYDFGILQYYEEGNLLQLMKRDELTTDKKYAILRQILSGIDFLHKNGIIHRDMKPQNILIANRRGEYVPKITDFGISKKLDINKSSIFSNSIAGAGTLAYASPEQLGDRTIRKNADLWSFGVIAFQLLTGKLPFTTGDHANTSEAGRHELFKQINSGVLPLAINQIAEPWQKVIKQCLIPDSNLRIQTTNDCFSILDGNNIGYPIEENEDETTIIDSPPPLPKVPPKTVNPVQVKSTPAKSNKATYIVVGAISGVVILFSLFAFIGFLLYIDSTSQSQPDMVTQPESVPTINMATTSDNNLLPISYFEDKVRMLYENLDKHDIEQVINDVYAKRVNRIYNIKTPVSRQRVLEEHQKYARMYPYRTYTILSMDGWRDGDNTIITAQVKYEISKTEDGTVKTGMTNEVIVFNKQGKIIEVYNN